jgi:two-component system, NtrC family, response regulator GlrR
MDSIRLLVLNCGANYVSQTLVDSVANLDESCRFEVSEAVLPANRAEAAQTLSDLLKQRGPDVILLAFEWAERAGAEEVLEVLRRERPEVPLIVATDVTQSHQLYRLLQLGASDFLTPPFRMMDLAARLWRLHKHVTGDAVARRVKQKVGMAHFVGESAVFVEAIRKIPMVANCDASVFISGESGTGKEICARAIHYLSPRSSKPFVPINCGAIPIDLIENELFGHEPGAFTGAAHGSPGLLRQADSGTIFLDEIDSLPLPAQVKFLRFLQEKEVRPLGGHKTHKVDVRVVTATNANLDDVLQRGAFRKDLYYRLNVVPMKLPPLRERREDIPLLVRHFQVKYAAAFSKVVKRFTPAAMQKLLVYAWPGNVRELENVIERAVVLAEEPEIRSQDLLLGETVDVTECESFQAAKARSVAQFETGYIRGMLMACNGNISKAARAAHKNRRAFWQLMRKHNITGPFGETRAS